ncbi:MAG: hypothetical protein HY820_31730 [Acidobacteria bacterium]|nr:hypothetical protein [Acidobacteriota bacterium]
MAGRGSTTFKKRQKEQQRQEKRQEKFAKRLEKKHQKGTLADLEIAAMEGEPGETVTEEIPSAATEQVHE